MLVIGGFTDAKAKGHEQKKNEKKSQLGLNDKAAARIACYHVTDACWCTHTYIEACTLVPGGSTKLRSVFSAQKALTLASDLHTCILWTCPILKYALIKESWILLESTLRKQKMQKKKLHVCIYFCACDQATSDLQ